MLYRSLFHRLLDVLSCVYNHETELDSICLHLGLNISDVEELISKLTEWGLLEAYATELTISKRGKKILAFYHNYSDELRVKPLNRTSIPDY